MEGRLKDQIAIVTGGGSGIGQATVLRFTAEGADVVAVDRNTEGVEETARMAGNGPGRVLAFTADVTGESAPDDVFARCLEAFGTPTILVNNAGIGAAKPVHTTDDAALDRFLDVNLRSLFRFARRGVVEMRAGGAGGSIVNIASIFGIVGFPGSSVYSATKSAVIGLSRNMAADYGRDGIRVNAIAPGLIVTPMTETRLAENAFFRDAMIGSTPMGRTGTPADIAAAATFLCSEDANFITGHTLTVDGGWSTTKYRPLPEEPYA